MTVWNFGSHYNFRPQKRACLTQALFIGVTPHKLHIHSRTTPFKNCILYLQQEKPRHDRRGDFMKYQKKMIVPALALALIPPMPKISGKKEKAPSFGMLPSSRLPKMTRMSIGHTMSTKPTLKASSVALWNCSPLVNPI